MVGWQRNSGWQSNNYRDGYNSNNRSSGWQHNSSWQSKNYLDSYNSNYFSSDTRLSKKMTAILRHTGDQCGLKCRADGYVPVRQMLANPDFRGFTSEDVGRVVERCPKKRFDILWETGEHPERLIRANQGHSLQGIVDESLLEEVCDAEELKSKGEVPVHGTYWRYWNPIKKDGLKKMSRNHIHFAPFAPWGAHAPISGMRANCELYVFLDVKKFFADGFKLFRSTNGVLLTRGDDGVVAPKYF